MLWSLVGARRIFTPAYWVFHPRTPDTCANIPPGVEAWVGDFEAPVIADKGVALHFVALHFALSNHWDTTEVTLLHLLITAGPMTHTTSTTRLWEPNYLLRPENRNIDCRVYHGIHYWNPSKSILVYDRVVDMHWRNSSKLTGMPQKKNCLDLNLTLGSHRQLGIQLAPNNTFWTCLKINCLNISHE